MFRVLCHNYILKRGINGHPTFEYEILGPPTNIVQGETKEYISEMILMAQSSREIWEFMRSSSDFHT